MTSIFEKKNCNPSEPFVKSNYVENLMICSRRFSEKPNQHISDFGEKFTSI